MVLYTVGGRLVVGVYVGVRVGALVGVVYLVDNECRYF